MNSPPLKTIGFGPAATTKIFRNKFLLFFIFIFAFKSQKIAAYPVQDYDSTLDGNIPIVDVQMVAQKRWLVSSKEFKNLQKELSYFIDTEIEKEKRRLMEIEDSKFHDMQRSFIQLVPNSRKKARNSK